MIDRWHTFLFGMLSGIALLCFMLWVEAQF